MQRKYSVLQYTACLETMRPTSH